MTSERLKQIEDYLHQYCGKQTRDYGTELLAEIDRLRAKCNRLIPAWANVPGDWMQPGDLDKEGA